MNINGTASQLFSQPVAALSPVGKQTVGLENADAKEEVLPPVEESAIAARADDEQREPEEASLQAQYAEGRINKDSAGDSENDEAVEEQQSREEKEQIRELAARDREVRAHEQAHAAAGGQYAGAPSYSYERGPDGVNYAVSGEVPISLPRDSGDPKKQLQAAEQVRRAALAPAEPSAQDRQVAAQASSAANQARAEIAAEQREREPAQQGQTDSTSESNLARQLATASNLQADSNTLGRVLSEQA